MDEQTSMKNVLLKSIGKKVDLCVICKDTDVVQTVKADFLLRLRQLLQGVTDLVVGNSVFIEELFLSGPKQAKHCLDCILSLFMSHDLQSVTIMGDGEPFEFYAGDFNAA